MLIYSVYDKDRWRIIHAKMHIICQMMFDKKIKYIYMYGDIPVFSINREHSYIFKVTRWTADK